MALVGDTIDTPLHLCRECGYDVTRVDWHKASYRCPECGVINIPGDPRVAPMSPRPWPAWWRAGAILLWPGAATGAVVGLHAWVDRDWSAMLSVFLGMLGGVLCLSWPAAATELLLYHRVSERRRRRFMPWFPLAGIIANCAAAVAVAEAMYAVA